MTSRFRRKNDFILLLKYLLPFRSIVYVSCNDVPSYMNNISFTVTTISNYSSDILLHIRLYCVIIRKKVCKKTLTSLVTSEQ